MPPPTRLHRHARPKGLWLSELALAVGFADVRSLRPWIVALAVADFAPVTATAAVIRKARLKPRPGIPPRRPMNSWARHSLRYPDGRYQPSSEIRKVKDLPCS